MSHYSEGIYVRRKLNNTAGSMELSADRKVQTYEGTGGDVIHAAERDLD